MRFQKPKLTTFFALFLLPFALAAQLTIRVTAIPANTPAGDKIYIAGNFNNWNSGSSSHILTEKGNGVYEIIINPTPGTVEFKFTRGSWATVEGNANGGFLPNRTFNYTGSAATIVLQIQSWEGAGSNSTAAPNVSILSSNFYMPQLNRNRRIWIYLPPDYATSTKKYPVLYLHDGQNLFDAATSFSGEWKVDESLNQLHAAGDYGCIVVGIDNGGANRTNEYCPWVNPQYGGGQGDLYIKFIAETLKPHIDANFRTLPGRISTGIGGSSLGGLISQFGLFERQDVFSKAAVFSPAFWINGSNSVNHVLAKGKQAESKVYFLAGGDEPNYVETDMEAVANAMLQVGFPGFDIYFKVPADGGHNEAFWAREFPEAYLWLFKNAVTNTNSAAAKSSIEIFPNPAADGIRLTNDAPLSFQILNLNGRILADSTVAAGEMIPTGQLPAGFYFLKFVEKNGVVALRKFNVVR